MTALRSALIALATLGICSLAHAEDAKPNPQQLEVKRMIGKWSGKGSMMTEGKTYPIQMNWDCGESAGAAGVRCRAQITGLPGFTYVFDDLWGWSAADGLVHWYTVTNAGEVHDHRGHLDAGGGLLQVEIPVNGKLFSEVITFKRKGKLLTMSWQTTHGGTVTERGNLELSSR